MVTAPATNSRREAVALRGADDGRAFLVFLAVMIISPVCSALQTLF
jgi:hypothetical protein